MVNTGRQYEINYCCVQVTTKCLLSRNELRDQLIVDARSRRNTKLNNLLKKCVKLEELNLFFIFLKYLTALYNTCSGGETEIHESSFNSVAHLCFTRFSLEPLVP